MDDSLQAQIDTYLRHLEGLIQRGSRLRDTLATDPSSRSALTAVRIWQQDCGVTINQLSGGSKAHWLARAFSEAFLMRAVDGRAAEGATAAEIVQRLINALREAVSSLPRVTSSEPAPSPRRFDFVHHSDLRPIVEQAYSDGRRALEENQFREAFFSFCGILEAIVTDALEHKGLSALANTGVPAGKIADWPFETRLYVGAKAGLIHSGYKRLPAVAFIYRNLDAGSEDTVISEHDARRAGQVLHVVMRDLDPGR
jgi:hypothetical protein